ncbi:VOC family protein [Pseudomonas sp. 7P_10.2_Bac1]|uniref:VOC family protein n=1 Tax=Pseudomonas sp. 7P_10.2_Bac1 TaxID=2971614 RepID=UPI0021C8F795|nr:VOC family protein [Pseudomonas sp. 7P_10.2_Bac1]MCU1726966.1 VOC family protein [Pseudomonas sp. 7P_10.2_Bac1]
MNHSNLFVLYVADAARSRVFYEQLLQKAPTSDFPFFVSFELSNHSHLGLWSEQAANFQSGGSGHRMEVGFLVDTEALVEAAYQRWQALGIAIEQPLARAVFGLTFVGLDPDGHRLRVCMPD